jgi:hypothetical protein
MPLAGEKNLQRSQHLFRMYHAEANRKKKSFQKKGGNPLSWPRGAKKGKVRSFVPANEVNYLKN